MLLDARYRVGPVLARGGMSTVHRGTDTRLDRPVAIKIMDPRLAADPAFRTRFEREARSAARIDHPAVVDVFDQGDWKGPGGDVLFLVMELVDGGTLRDVLRARGSIGVPAAFAVLDPVLAGLAQAHRLGMVHRDVKPENVLISRTGEVKVADFGLVTAAAQAGQSHVGMIMGTVAYLSPEQVATGSADARSDVYATGVLLYELLTGTPPYTGDTALSVAYRHVNSDVPAPSTVAGDVPPELDDLVRRATSRDPARRPADAAAFLGELRRLGARLDVPRVPAPVPPPRPVEEQDTVPPGPHRVAPNRTRLQPRPPGGTSTMAPVLDRPPPHLAARRRGRRVFAVAIALVALLALAVGVTAWWLGTGRWTSMPDVVGLQQASAQQLIAGAGLAASAVEEFDGDYATGLVADTDTRADTRLLRGTAVHLTISAGRPTVPRVAPGTEVASANEAVRDAGLEPVGDASAAEFSDSVPDGAVIHTVPAEGTELDPGDPVTLVLSTGPKPSPPAQVRVPFLIGEQIDRAEEILGEAGLKVEEHMFPFGREHRTVVNQDHGAGSMVDPGTLVVLDTF